MGFVRVWLETRDVSGSVSVLTVARAGDQAISRHGGPEAWPAPGAGGNRGMHFTPGQINTLSLIKWPIGLWTSLNLKLFLQPHYTLYRLAE